MKNGDGPAPKPEDVWLKFLLDDERAIRASAPRELSAHERTSRLRPKRPCPAPTDKAPGLDMVGEAWQPTAPGTGPTWHDLDTRARLRRVGHAVATGAAITAALLAWSWLSTTGSPADDRPDDTTVQQFEPTHELPAIGVSDRGSPRPYRPRSSPSVE